METKETDRETLGVFIADVVDAATSLAADAAESAAELAGQAVGDARRVADSFEALMDAAAREGVEIARNAVGKHEGTVRDRIGVGFGAMQRVGGHADCRGRQSSPPSSKYWEMSTSSICDGSRNRSAYSL